MCGHRRNRALAAILLVLVVLEIAGCKKESRAPTSDRLILGTRTEPRSLDPAFVRQSGAQEIVRLLYKDLTDFDDRWRLRPVLARALPEASTSSVGARAGATGGAMNGGWVVEWQLRPGLKWSDGQPLTTADFAFGHLIETNDRLRAVNHPDAARVDRVVVIDPLRVRVYWREPFIGFRAPRVHAILPAHAYPRPEPGRPFVGLTDVPVSSGPFRVERWVRGEQLVLTRNAHWSGPRPSLEKIVFRFLRSQDALEAELLAGTIDAVGESGGLSPRRAAELSERLHKTHEVVLTDSAARLSIECRADHPLVGRADVRRALSAVVDRARFGAIAYGGAARPAWGLFPPRHAAFIDEPGTLSTDEARRRLAALEEQPSVALQFASDHEAARAAAVFLQNIWSKAGFPVVLDGRPFAVLLELLAKRQQGPLVLVALRMRPDWDGRSALHSDGRQNYGGHIDQDIDGWIESARSTPDPVVWAALLRKVERRYQRDLPSIPLVYRKTVSIRPRKLEGWKPTGTTTPVTWNAEEWHWSQESEATD